MPLCLLGVSRSKDIASLSCPGLPNSIEFRWVTREPLAAATVGASSTSFEPLEHARLLDAIHARFSVLPVRYGVALPDEAAIQAFLSSRWKDLSNDLDRLEGTSEIGVHIEFARSPAPEEPPASSGSSCSNISPARYLALRFARYQRHDQLNAQAQLAAATCVRTLEGLYRSWRRLSPERSGIVRLAFLVDRRRSRAFVRRLETCNADKASQRYTVLGPWPPYSFVGEISLAGGVQCGGGVDARQSQ